MMESLVTEWAGRRLPARAHRRDPAERRAVQRLPDRRRRADPDRRQPGHRVPPAGRGDGRPGAGRRPPVRHARRPRAHHDRARRDDRRVDGALDADDLLARLHDGGVPAGRIYRAQDMLADPHFAAREAIVRVAHPDFGELAMQNVVPRAVGDPRPIRVGPGARRAQRRGLPRPARPLATDRDQPSRLTRPTASSERAHPPARRRGARMTYRLGVDVGGTFTDLLCRRGQPARPGGPRLPRRRTTSPSACWSASRRSCAEAGIARRRSTTSCTAPRSRPTRCWRARAPGSAWSPPRATGRCCRSPGPSCRAVWPAGSSGPSRTAGRAGGHRRGVGAGRSDGGGHGARRGRRPPKLRRAAGQGSRR